MSLTVARARQLLLISACLFSQAFINLHLISIHVPWEEPATERRQKLNPTLFSALSFGHLPALIDWITLKAFADHAATPVETGSHSQLYYDFDMLTDLDPLFFELYIGGSHLLTVISKDHSGALELVTKSETYYENEVSKYPVEFLEKFWTFPWRIYVLKAYIEIFEFHDMQRAADSFNRAAVIPGAPAYLVRLSQRLHRPTGKYEVGLRLLTFYIETSRNPRLRAEFEKKKLNLFIGQYLFELNQNFLEYVKILPGYRIRDSIPLPLLQRYWKDYLRTNQISKVDPWGGEIHLDSSGKVVSTTPHVPVFGLE